MMTETSDVTSCPNEEEILRWTAGHFLNTSRHEEIEDHLARCCRCAVDLDISMAVCNWVAETEVEKDRQEGKPKPAGHPERDGTSVRKFVRLKKEAHRILADPPALWGAKLLEHPDREDAVFLSEVADRTVWYADEVPDAVLDFVNVVRPLVKALPESYFNDCQYETSMALLGLAQGVALRTKGDHVAALRSYDEADGYIPDRALSMEHARINLARAASFRALNRLDDAMGTLYLSRHIYGRYTNLLGEAKVLWEMGSVAYQMGDARRAFRMGKGAYRAFVKMGDETSASMVLLALVGFLVTLHRAIPAHRIARQLVENEPIQRNAVLRAGLTWQRARVAVVKGDLDAAAELLDHAAREFSDAGAGRRAACVWLDRAHLAGETGDVATRAEAAHRALTFFAALPAQETELALVIREIEEALRTGVRIGETIAAARDRLRAQ